MTDHKMFLGQLLQDNSILYESKISVSDFVSEFNIRVFTAIKAIFLRGDVADLATIHDYDKEIDPYKLSTLTDNIISATWKQTEKRIIDDTNRRKLLSIADMIQNESDVDTAISEIHRQLEEFNDRSEYEITSSRDVSDQAINLIEERYKLGGQLPGIRSGLNDLDDKTLGFEKRRLYVIGARPSQGKTAILLNFLNNSKETAGVISAESSSKELMMRIYAINGRIRQKKIVSGMLTDKDFSKMIDTNSAYTDRDVYFYDEPNMSIDTVIIKAREMKRRFNIKILYVDYLQCLTGDKNLKRHEQVADISRNLKSIARSLDIPVVVAAQLRRTAENERPLLSDFSDSTQIERDADTAIMIHNKKSEGKTYLLIEKNRDGECVDVEVLFNKEFMRFENIKRTMYEN